MTSYPSGGPTAPPDFDQDQDLDQLLAAISQPDPAPTPTPRPTSNSLPEWAAWLHRSGYRVGEDKPKSKHSAKHHDGDNGQRRTLAAVRSAWDKTPNANVSIRAGWQRGGKGVEAVFLVVLDADGAKADAFVQTLLEKAGILDSTPRCVRPSGGGAKYLLRSRYPVKTARLLVPGCKNAGHDGLELLAAGSKAVPPQSNRDRPHRRVTYTARRFPCPVVPVVSTPPSRKSLSSKST